MKNDFVQGRQTGSPARLIPFIKMSNMDTIFCILHMSKKIKLKCLDLDSKKLVLY